MCHVFAGLLQRSNSIRSKNITHQQQLDTDWQFLAPASDQWLAAQVPGCIHTDLQAHGLIPDPFYGTNELRMQWVGERDWKYRTEFIADAELLAQSQVDLICEGLDTAATVTLNGETILESRNMFHRHRTPVGARLRPGVNALGVKFGSAFDAIQAHKAAHAAGPQPVDDRTRIRKTQSQFGWDWGPTLVTCGVWRPVFLEGWSDGRIETVAVEQEHEGGRVRLRLTPELDTPDPDARFRAILSLGDADVASAEGGAGGLTLEVADPRLWWPAGQGAQPLYRVRVDLIRAGRAVSRWERRIGLRTITLDMEVDGFDVQSWSGRPLARFGFRVNGRLIFAKGANWIPGHSFAPSLTDTDCRGLLQSARDAHFNMVRAWGGGVYESDVFYDVCDELGLLVWQDFTFACRRYPADADFAASVRKEAEDNVTRLRHHAGLALWCGGNEMASLCPPDGPEEYRRDYAALFLDALPSVVRALDPATAYIHDSPAYAIEGLPASHLPSQDEHDWNVFHGRKPVEYYETTHLRFASEFGMQSYPSVPVAETFCPPDNLNVLSPVFESHQKSTAGNEIILHYVAEQFRFPRDYRSMAYLSQLNQALCVQAAVEHFRRRQPQCLGALYWQLNDCWPGSSWSSLEFGGRWKALHYYARRFYAPYLVSIRHHGRDWAGLDNFRHNTRGVVDVYTVSDAPEPLRALLSWELSTLDGRVAARGERGVMLKYGTSVLQETLDFTVLLAEIGKDNTYLRVVLRADDGGELSRSVVEFVPPRFLRLGNSPMFVEAAWVSETERTLILSSAEYKYGVYIEPPAGVVVSDNYFPLCPGEPRTITLCHSRSLSPEHLPPILSLVDTYR